MNTAVAVAEKSIPQTTLELPENLLSIRASSRAWNGVTVHLTEFDCNGAVVHRLDHEDQTRLSVILEEVGQHAEPRFSRDRPCPIAYMPKHMLFAPAGLEIWGYSEDARYVKDATLTFDVEKLSERLGVCFDSAVLTTPQIRFVDSRVWSLVELLAKAVGSKDPSIQLYGDSLTAALASCLLMKPNSPTGVGCGLSPRQLRSAIDYMNANLPNHVPLADLAALSGLSQWHFCRAFKASTGMAPYQWQLKERIRRSQILLMDTCSSIELVSEATGFSDAAHFVRTFRKLVGATPSVWRKSHQT
ncbi:AraC family transcriptional regulator [Massilia sp. KIM]|uniref:helix-turn-helix domain-containing protein n=1 Tax=Massilia sp. KIM TaxID=1955422 RepID=UPI00098ED895|nr:AraC family transcriptional regulator [Massilia sp. KIM]OON62512.1 AraC family transcriptional regulator [Massilia sp. KIM]